MGVVGGRELERNGKKVVVVVVVVVKIEIEIPKFVTRRRRAKRQNSMKNEEPTALLFVLQKALNDEGIVYLGC